jgi:aldehyde dehydrogenase (NAD+)
MSELIEVHASLLKNHKSGVTRPYNFRMKQLKGVKQFLINEEKVIAEALRQDLHRSDFEAVGVEITTVLTELNYAIKHLHEWMEPIRTPVAAMFAPASSEIHHEPFGLCLILGAFNYPITLTVSAIY